MRSAPPRLPLLAPIAAALLSLGCQVERTLEVRSEPPGATVRLGDELLGTTPLEVGFEHYGTRRASFYLKGHRPLSRPIELDAPWWDTFPFDIASELLLPFGWHDTHRLTVRLVPESGEVSRGEFEEVLQRAEALRRAGPTGPRPTPPTPATRDEGTPPDTGGPEGGP